MCFDKVDYKIEIFAQIYLFIIFWNASRWRVYELICSNNVSRIYSTINLM